MIHLGLKQRTANAIDLVLWLTLWVCFLQWYRCAPAVLTRKLLNVLYQTSTVYSRQQMSQVDQKQGIENFPQKNRPRPQYTQDLKLCMVGDYR